MNHISLLGKFQKAALYSSNFMRCQSFVLSVPYLKSFFINSALLQTERKVILVFRKGRLNLLAIQALECYCLCLRFQIDLR